MSKKNFTGGLSSLLGDQPEKPKRGRPITQLKEVNNEAERGTLEGEIRATFIVKKELPEKLRAIAYWDRLLIKDVINTALQDAINKYIKKNGAIKPIPKK